MPAFHGRMPHGKPRGKLVNSLTSEEPMPATRKRIKMLGSVGWCAIAMMSTLNVRKMERKEKRTCKRKGK